MLSRFSICERAWIPQAPDGPRRVTVFGRMSCVLSLLLLTRFGLPDAGPILLDLRVPLLVLSNPNGAGTVDVTILDPKTIVHRSTNAQGIPSNGLIAVTEGGLLLVDTAWTEAETEALLKW